VVRVSTLEEILGPQIELTIDGLKRKRFTPDPISGKYYSKIASLIGSACKLTASFWSERFWSS